MHMCIHIRVTQQQRIKKKKNIYTLTVGFDCLYISGIENIDYLSTMLLESARKTDTNSLRLKYTSSRFGGEAPDGTRG
jgi:hypothetical protein